MMFDILKSACKYQPPPGFPPAAFVHGKQGCIEGILLMGHFNSPVAEIATWDKHDNHPAINQNLKAVENKFAKEKEKSFHLYFLCFSVTSSLASCC
jgi:hypothetical protein